MATIKFRPDGQNINFSWQRDGKVRASYSVEVYVDLPNVSQSMVSRYVDGSKLLTMAQFDALIDSGATAFKTTIKNFIETQILDEFGSSNTIEEDNSDNS